MKEWVKAYERAPTESGYYIVYIKDTDPWEMKDGELLDSSYVDCMYYDARQFIFRDNQGFYFNMMLAKPMDEHFELTHWMELPEAPKE